jgi:hypothetical protein
VRYRGVLGTKVVEFYLYIGDLRPQNNWPGSRDLKVVKASYNSGAKERIVHVTEIKKDQNDNRSRFIIGARPTELDRNGEWGAALSILDALIPLPDDRVIVVSGDAGICIEEFCKWLNEKGFFLHLQD